MLYERGKAWHTLLAAAIVLPILVFLGARGPVLILWLAMDLFCLEKICSDSVAWQQSCCCVYKCLTSTTLCSINACNRLSVATTTVWENGLSTLNLHGAPFRSTPLLGVGFGGFGMFHRDVDERCYPHNIILEIWAELGLVGTWGFLVGHVCLPPDRYVPTRLTISLLVCFYLLQLMKSSSFVDSKYLFIFVGLLFTTAHEAKNVLIVDYGCGNVGSLKTMLSRLKCDVSV